MQPQQPLPQQLLDAYSDFLGWRERVFSCFSGGDTITAGDSHLAAAQGLVASAHALTTLLERHAGAGDEDRPPFCPSQQISSALWIAVPALLVRTGYTTPPPPTFEGLLNQITRATMHLHRAREHPGSLRQAADALAVIGERVQAAARSDPPSPATAHLWQRALRGVWRMSRALLPFVTAATAVACAPLLVPTAAAGVLTAIASPLTGVLLPTPEALLNAFKTPPAPATPHTQLLTTAATTALQEARQLLRDNQHQQADWACQAAEHHLDALLLEPTDTDVSDLAAGVIQLRQALCPDPPPLANPPQPTTRSHQARRRPRPPATGL
ncbi:hypothetical protein [Streptomyces sp. NBC_00005]|uniref:hypothetical protein n=1 Tax=Streptomyces sp. NBC_00005 TaxID=2903609 RepID=UPI00324AB223